MKRTLLILSLLLLTACSSVLPEGKEAPKLYTLNAPEIARVQQRSNVSLQILLPQAAPGLDTERIALRQSANRIEYYADQNWAASPPVMLQNILVESFDRSGALASTGNDLAAIRDDKNLLVEMRDFQVESETRAHVRLVAKLIDSASQNVETTASYDESEEAAGRDLDSIAAAFDAATQRAVTRIVADTIETIEGQMQKVLTPAPKIVLTPPVK